MVLHLIIRFLAVAMHPDSNRYLKVGCVELQFYVKVLLENLSQQYTPHNIYELNGSKLFRSGTGSTVYSRGFPSSTDDSVRDNNSKNQILPSDKETKGRDVKTAIIGASIGSFFGALVLFIFCYIFIRRRKRAIANGRKPSGSSQEESAYAGGNNFSKFELPASEAPVAQVSESKAPDSSLSELDTESQQMAGSVAVPTSVEQAYPSNTLHENPTSISSTAQSGNSLLASTEIFVGTHQRESSSYPSSNTPGEPYSTLEPIDYHTADSTGNSQRVSDLSLHVSVITNSVPPTSSSMTTDAEAEIARLEEEARLFRERRELLEKEQAVRQRISELGSSSTRAVQGPSWQ